METNWNQLIERYFQNELSDEGKEAFENELKRNPAIGEEVEVHKLVQEASKRAGQRLVIQKIGKRYKLLRQIKWTIGILLFVGFLSFVGMLSVSKTEKRKVEEQKEIKKSVLPDKDDQFKKEIAKDSVWFEAQGQVVQVITEIEHDSSFEISKAKLEDKSGSSNQPRGQEIINF